MATVVYDVWQYIVALSLNRCGSHRTGDSMPVE